MEAVFQFMSSFSVLLIEVIIPSFLINGERRSFGSDIISNLSLLPVILLINVYLVGYVKSYCTIFHGRSDS